MSHGNDTSAPRVGSVWVGGGSRYRILPHTDVKWNTMARAEDLNDEGLVVLIPHEHFGVRLHEVRDWAALEETANRIRTVHGWTLADAIHSQVPRAVAYIEEPVHRALAANSSSVTERGDG